jgi:hypothetical protein
MNIGDVLGKPFKYIWQNGFLWALGMVTQIIPTTVSFLAAFFLIMNSETLTNFLQNAQFYSYRPDLLEHVFANVRPDQILGRVLPLFGLIMLVNLVSWLASEFIACCIIQGTRLADTTQERIKFKDVLKEGWKPFGKLVLQDLLWMVGTSILFTGGILLLVGLPMDQKRTGILVGILCCLSCFIVPVIIFTSLLITQIRVSLVHDNLGVFPSMGKGWKTFMKAFGWFLLLALILWIGQIIPRSILAFIRSGIDNATRMTGVSSTASGLQTTQIIALAIFSLVGFFLGSFIFAYVNSAWTMAYRSVNHPPAVPPAIPLPIPVVNVPKARRIPQKPTDLPGEIPSKAPRKPGKPKDTSS